MANQLTIHSMEKRTVRNNLYHYFFHVEDELGLNSIFVCVDEQQGKKRALIIDTAFPEMADMVKKDLEDNDIQPEIVIISHYHPDHAGGVTSFPNCRIYGSRHYDVNIENCRRWRPDLTYKEPTNLIAEGDTLTFGSTELRFFEAPGHSCCGLLILIDGDILHVGDLLMYNIQKRITLPYIAMTGSFTQHIESLERIRSIGPNKLLIPHGEILDDKETIDREIEERTYYLNRVQNSNGTLPLAVCLKRGLSNYCHTEYHDTNLIYLML
jgi:glyoxylase-like metal-dependent hydrolase (beta-lactamase superfamily II)